MQRVAEEELLDSDCGAPDEIARALEAIHLANRRFGGVRLHARLLARALATRRSESRLPHILEVASGRGDVLRRALVRLKTPATVTLLDRSAAHLPDPTTWPSGWLQPTLITGDALDLPLADKSVDIVACCLFLHHLEPPDVARFLAEALRVARIAVIINDLERHALHYQLAKLNRLIDPSRISRHDGPVSVRRAYTRRELASILTHTGRRFSIERAYLFRLGAVLWCDP